MLDGDLRLSVCQAHDAEIETVRQETRALREALAQTWQPIETCPYKEYVLLVETMEPSGSDLHLNPSAKPVTSVTVGKRLGMRNSDDEWQRYGVGSILASRLSLWMPLPFPASPGAQKET